MTGRKFFIPERDLTLDAFLVCSMQANASGKGNSWDWTREWRIYTRNRCSRSAKNIIKILILFWSSVTLLANCDTFAPIYPPPPPRPIIPSRCADISPLFYYPTICSWNEGNRRWQTVHFTLAHKLSAAIFYPVGVWGATHAKRYPQSENKINHNHSLNR